jgi:uncharacterized protein
MYVSGLGATLAKNIIDYRREHGAFTSRSQLLKVPRLGPSAYQQCAGFLRIHNAKNPLDGTAVHPESYPIVQQMAKDQGCTVADLIQNKEKREALELPRYVTADVGMPTLTDIMAELEKPGRDPREDLPAPLTRQAIVKLSDIKPGTIMRGTVRNITDFGVFVDIGIKTAGLIHISELSNKRVRHPLDVVAVGDVLNVMVINVDEERGRIGLSLRQVPAEQSAV